MQTMSPIATIIFNLLSIPLVKKALIALRLKLWLLKEDKVYIVESKLFEVNRNPKIRSDKAPNPPSNS